MILVYNYFCSIENHINLLHNYYINLKIPIISLNFIALNLILSIYLFVNFDKTSFEKNIKYPLNIYKLNKSFMNSKIKIKRSNFNITE